MANDTLGSFDIAIPLTDKLAYARADQAIIAEGLATSRKTSGSPAPDPDAIERVASAPAPAREESAR